MADDGADGPKSNTQGVSSQHSTEDDGTGSHHEASWYSIRIVIPWSHQQLENPLDRHILDLPHWCARL